MFTTIEGLCEHQISVGPYHTLGLRQKDSIVFIVQRKNCERKLPKTGTMHR